MKKFWNNWKYTIIGLIIGVLIGLSASLSKHSIHIEDDFDIVPSIYPILNP